MNVVFLCQQDPWPLNGGALIRNYWLVRALAREHRVHLVTAGDPAESVPADFAEACASISRFPRPAGTRGRLRRVLKALRPASSYYTSGTVTAAMRRAVATLASQPKTFAMIDLALHDALRGTHLPYIFNAHNTEHELQRRRAGYAGQPLRTFLRVEAERTRRIEREVLRGSLLTAACSPDDRDELARLDAPGSAKICVVPNGVDVARYAGVAARIASGRTILVTGSYDWRPNIVGLEWFINEVLPELRVRMPGGFDVRVAGRMSDALAARLDALDDVAAVPRPDDMRDELARACIVVAPILPSSGTRLRILEAWAAGRPVATTPSGALGLQHADGEDILVAEGARELAGAAARLLESSEVRARVRAGGLARAESYDWHAIGTRFLAASAAALQRIA